MVLSAQGVAAVERAVDHLEEWRDVSELTALLHRHGRE